MISTTLKIILTVGVFLMLSLLWVGLLNLAFKWMFGID
jgi:hypothetical protein